MPKRVYLGTRVPDTGRRGLDNLRELQGIINGIINDVRRGKISCTKGKQRMALLYLVVKRVFLQKYPNLASYQRARAMVDRGMQTLMRMCNRQR